jgi:hypothetical protein
LEKLRTEYAELHKKDLEMSKKLEIFQCQITAYRDEKDSLEQKVMQITRQADEVGGCFSLKNKFQDMRNCFYDWVFLQGQSNI